jgi:TatD DNase family protein
MAGMPQETESPELIDAHCHLAHGRLRQQVAAVLDRARAARVTRVICAAGTIAESKAALSLARAHEGVYCTAGLHPHDAKDAPGHYLAAVERLAAEPCNVAVGEIGLDYHYDFSPRAVQQRVFAEQLQLAERVGKPVVVHSREAFDDTLAVLAESGAAMDRVVLHSCTEDAQNVARALDLGAAVSFSGIVTFKKADALRAAAAIVPDDRLLIETDSPYLSPEPVRKMKTNEPAHVAHVAACLAAVRGTSADALARLTTANAVRLFRLPG